jgi:hypothetical protein
MFVHNEQASPISKGVAEIQINSHRVREITWQHDTRVATFPIDYQRVEQVPPYPSAVFHVKTSPGSPWVARTLFQCHPWSTVGCRPTQRPSTLLSLWDAKNPVCVSTQLNSCWNRAQPTQSLIDTGGSYHLGTPNLTSDHSHHSHPVFPTFP